MSQKETTPEVLEKEPLKQEEQKPEVTSPVVDDVEESLPDNAEGTDETLQEKSSTDSQKETTEEEKKEEMIQIPKQRYEELVNAEAIALEEVKRARADSINFRRRVEKEKEDFKKFASAHIFKKLIPLVDDFQRLLEHGREEIPEHHLASIESLKQRLEGIFEQEGVKIIAIEKKVTKFDPTYHEAVFAQPTDEVEPNIILEVVSNGFYKEDTVLRPAKVVVSKKPEPTQPTDASENQPTNENRGE